MYLSVRPSVYKLPSYSLTGDLLGFLRCGLQYRYTRLGRLPPSRPVQLWFGEFIHGVMEEAYRSYREMKDRGVTDLPPWPDERVASIEELIERRLAARGLVAWSEDLRGLGRRRADAAIQQLGPILFPLIAEAEVRLSGARLLPRIPAELEFRAADRYEMIGIVDVLTEVQLSDPALSTNPLLQLIQPNLPPDPPPSFEVIVDYKGMRRPPSGGGTGGTLWTQYLWQILTYAQLRARQAGAKPVVAGVLIYINELWPTRSDLGLLKEEVISGATDIMPQPGSRDAEGLRRWGSRGPLIALSWEYRLARAIRVVPVTPEAVRVATDAFDGVVQEIETCMGTEVGGGPLLGSWSRNPSDESSCVVCDSRTYCPDYQRLYAAANGEQQPKLPAWKA